MANGVERMDFSDMQKYNSESNLTNGKKSKSGGCYVSTAVGFVMVLLVIAIAVGVGLIVHFAGGQKTVVCSWPPSNGAQQGQQGGNKGTTTPSSDYVKTQCKKMAMDGEMEICMACPSGTTGMTTPSPTSKPLVKDVRIPLALYPLYYDIEIRPNMYEGAAENFTFNGFTRIQLRCDTPTRNVTLHTNKLQITPGSLEFGAEPGTAAAPSIENWEWDKDRQFMVIHLDGLLVKDGLYYVKMNYTGPLSDDLHGLYLSKYEQNNDTIYVAATQFQPTDARKTFPCFDEPAIKSNFNITLVRKNHLKSLSNMPIIDSQDRGDNWVADVYQTTPKMPTYLLAFIVCNFEYTNETTSNDILYRAWSRPESVDQTPYALDVGVKVLTYFEKYFDVKFPLPKQDMIAIPDFAAGAMENWGLITYRETAMLYEPGVSSEGNKQRVAVVVSHELAHQWFGDLVTPSWWDDLWLNEGFASFVEYMGVDFVHPDWKMFEQFVVEDLQDVFDFDSLISSHPVYVPVAHPDEINEIFDRISYAKGASIIRMMRFFLGEETFRVGLSNYLKSKAYGAAFHDDLWTALTKQSAKEGKNINVKEVMDTWTLQMNYPVVMVIREGTRIRVSQQRFLTDPNAKDPGKYTSSFGYKWEIPFAYTSSVENDFNKTDADISWIKPDSNELIFDNPSVIPPRSDNVSWVLGNPMQYGFYRVNYDTANWMALVNQLKTDHRQIHTINRAQIINDAWSLAKAGMLPQDMALQTVEYLDRELEYVPWAAAIRQLGYVDTMLTKTGLYGAFGAFMKAKVQMPFNTLTMNNTGASHLTSYIRSLISGSACSYGITACTDESLRLFREWMATPSNNPIDPGLKSTVYCTAIKYGGVLEWDFAFTQYKTATVAAESARLLSSMGCSREPWILSRFLNRALMTEQVRKQDALNVLVYVSRNSIGQGLAWDFFRNRWETIRNDYGTAFFAFTRLIGGITESFNTPFQLKQLQTFVDTHPDQGSGKRAFEQAMEKTNANIKWMDANVQSVQTWLKNQGFYTE
ncbi:aminopeptidase N-like [Haliotis rufescens]|uniref:aminopeptidase N-like n=1 Tax=Haliotis rufescens TaxID=6454 RepID=UPI00201E9FD0|nr:aminopeptidase N-like [Haliotis rufescens]